MCGTQWIASIYVNSALFTSDERDVSFFFFFHTYTQKLNVSINVYMCHNQKPTVTSVDASDTLDESENTYENCAVIAAQSAVTPVEDMESRWHELIHRIVINNTFMQVL